MDSLVDRGCFVIYGSQLVRVQVGEHQLAASRIVEAGMTGEGERLLGKYRAILPLFADRGKVFPIFTFPTTPKPQVTLEFTSEITCTETSTYLSN